MQMRKDAVQTLATVAAAVQIQDPLFPNQSKLVITPVVKQAIELKPSMVEVAARAKYDKVVLVRKAALAALAAMETLPDPDLPPGKLHVLNTSVLCLVRKYR